MMPLGLCSRMHLNNKSNVWLPLSLAPPSSCHGHKSHSALGLRLNHSNLIIGLSSQTTKCLMCVYILCVRLFQMCRVCQELLILMCALCPLQPQTHMRCVHKLNGGRALLDLQQSQLSYLFLIPRHASRKHPLLLHAKRSINYAFDRLVPAVHHAIARFRSFCHEIINRLPRLYQGSTFAWCANSNSANLLSYSRYPTER